MPRCWSVLLLASLATLSPFAAAPASAAEPTQPAAAALVETVTARSPERRLEGAVLPLLSGSSDRGFGFGAVATLARFDGQHLPFYWRLQLVSYMTVGGSRSGLPYQRHQLKLDLPQFLWDRLRLNLDASFIRTNSEGYYGIGNASSSADQGEEYHRYWRQYPRLRLQSRLALTEHTSVLVGGAYTYNQIDPYPDSKLEQDLQSADSDTADLLQGADSHSLTEITLGMLWNSRDHEYAPSSGSFHELTWRFSPGEAERTYSGANLTLRFYRALYRRKLVLAVRLMADLLHGNPPFYELVRHGGLSPDCSLGGGSAVRGVPLHRYSGKIKALANSELRAQLLPFSLLGQRFNLGVLAFFDAGRVWADYQTKHELDGRGLGLKLGVGGGLRLQWGETVVVRFDAAWSPDAEPVGLYFDVNHIF